MPAVCSAAIWAVVSVPVGLAVVDPVDRRDAVAEHEDEGLAAATRERPTAGPRRSPAGPSSAADRRRGPASTVTSSSSWPIEVVVQQHDRQ